MSRSLLLFACLCVPFLFVPAALAQDISDEPISPDEVKLSARNFGGLLAPPGSAANFIQFPADPQGGGDLFDVVTSDARAVVSLILPDGTEVSAANAGALGFAYTKAAPGTFDNLMIPNTLSTRGAHTIIILPVSAPPGTYKVKADVSSITDTTDKIVVLASHFSSSSIRAGLKVNYQNTVGRPVLLGGLLFNDSAPVTGAVLTATVEERSQLSVPRARFPLLDSGSTDAEPGDGIYSGEFTPTRAGIYVVAVRATGVSPSGLPFARVVSATFRVTEPLASFTSFHDAGVDADSDGLFDRIEVGAAVNVQKAGRYQFGITLLAGNGRRVNATAAADLQVGAQMVAVSFPAEEILHLGAGGPYAMKDAILTYQANGEELIADSREDAGNTAAYSLTGLERPDVFFTGQGTAAGLDTNGNGKYDILRVQAEVLIRFAGSYQWSGSLFDNQGREIDFFSGGGSLNAGSNNITFNFSGTKIGSHGVDGPYTVGSVLILSSQASKSVAHLFDTPAFSHTDFEGAATPRKILFRSNRDAGRYEIYAMNVDGSSQTNLTRTPTSDEYLDAWSPDGRKVAFAVESEGGFTWDIFVMNADGSSRMNLTRSNAYEFTFGWSPDSTRIAFESTRDGTPALYVMNVDGTGITRLINTGFSDLPPAWSPDGTKIAYVSYVNTNAGSGDIFVISPNGGNPTNLTNSPEREISPVWSPDGTKILYRRRVSSSPGPYSLYVMNANGSGVLRLTNDSGAVTTYQWSPDGTKIAFTSNRSGNYEVYVMNADGSGQVNLTNHPGSDFVSGWSPDGTRILFVSYRDGNSEVYAMNADGSGQVNLTANPAFEEMGQWQPGAP